MENTSLKNVFYELITIGINWTLPKEEKKVGSKIPLNTSRWQDEFNLSAWKGWTCEIFIHSSQFSGKTHERIQEVSVRGIFKKDSALGIGHNSLMALAVNFIRGVPADFIDDETKHQAFTEFYGIPWIIQDIRYFSSPEKITSPIFVDVLKKRT